LFGVIYFLKKSNITKFKILMINLEIEILNTIWFNYEVFILTLTQTENFIILFYNTIIINNI